jgi:hypothetical protein
VGDEKKLTVAADTLAAGLQLQTGTPYTVQLQGAAPKDEMGIISVVVRDHEGHDPIVGKPYEVSGPHGVHLSGTTPQDGSVRSDQSVPIDHYKLHVCDTDFDIVARPAASGALIVRVPGAKVPPTPNNQFGPPPRSGGLGGRKFLAACTNVLGTADRMERMKKREEEMFAELVKGNLPDQCRVWCEIPLDDDKGNRGSVKVLADCLAIGSNDDWIRINLSAYTSQRIADEWKCLLPTSKIVALTYKHAKHKFIYHGLQAYDHQGGYWQFSNEAMLWIDDINQGVKSCEDAHFKVPPDIATKFDPHLGPGYDAIRNIHKGRCMLPNPHPLELVSGNKKEVIISHETNNPQCKNGQQLSFMGFYDETGKPTQHGWTAIHFAGFTDAAQGTRLVHPDMTVNGKPAKYEEVLQNSNLCGLVIDTKNISGWNAEAGPLKSVRYPKPPAHWQG